MWNVLVAGLEVFIKLVICFKKFVLFLSVFFFCLKIRSLIRAE